MPSLRPTEYFMANLITRLVSGAGKVGGVYGGGTTAARAFLLPDTAPLGPGTITLPELVAYESTSPSGQIANAVNFQYDSMTKTATIDMAFDFQHFTSSSPLEYRSIQVLASVGAFGGSGASHSGTVWSFPVTGKFTGQNGEHQTMVIRATLKYTGSSKK